MLRVAYDSPMREKIPLVSHTPRPLTSSNELVRVRDEQLREQEWWGSAPVMKTRADIDSAVESGGAVRVPEKGEGYQLSPGIKDEFKVLEKQTFELMEQICAQWQSRVRGHDAMLGDVYLRVTSLARTVEYQEELILKGYPASENSTHTKLGAFDLLSSWLEANRPDLLGMLDEILEPLQQEGRINWIKEPEIGAYHIAANPAKAH